MPQDCLGLKMDSAAQVAQSLAFHIRASLHRHHLSTIPSEKRIFTSLFQPPLRFLLKAESSFLIDVAKIISIAICYKQCYTGFHEIQSVAGEPSQNLVAPHRRRRTNRIAPGRADRIQTSPHFQFPQSQAGLESRRHGQGPARPAPFRSRPPRPR